MGCHSDCRDAFCDHGGCMGCGHCQDCCPECGMPNADQRACLTLEYRDNVCEHCLKAMSTVLRQQKGSHRSPWLRAKVPAEIATPLAGAIAQALEPVCILEADG